MRALVHSATGARAARLGGMLRAEGYAVEERVGPPPHAPIDASAFALVVVDLELGLPALRALCEPLAQGRPGELPPLIALVGADLRDEDVAPLVAAGVNTYMVDDTPAFAVRMRFLRRALESRGRMMAEARAAQARYRTVLDVLDEGLLVQDADGTVLTFNPAAERILGLDGDALRKRPWLEWEFVYRDGRPMPREEQPAVRAFHRGEPVRAMLCGIRRPGRELLWLSMNSHPLSFDGTSRLPSAIVTAFSDVTELRRIEEELRELLEAAPDAIMIRHERRICWVNRRWATLLGHDDPAALVGADVLDSVPHRHQQVVAERIRQRDLGMEVPTIEHEMRRRDGSEVVVSVYSMPIIFEGEPATIVIARDLTEQRRLETRLVAADRLAALGRLAAGVGHEINTPLMYVTQSIDGAIASLRHDPERALRLLDEARDGVSRIARITRDLNVFTARRPEGLEPVDVHRVVEACVRITHNQIRHRATLVRDFGDVPPILTNEARLTQVLLNLLVNAVQAIPDGHTRSNTIVVATRREPDGRVALRVSDSGVGIAPDDLPRVFEPFFTTRGEHGGMGLGLSVSQLLVASLGGEISVESQVGVGTTFTVRLPAVAERHRITPPATPSVPAKSRRRVLLVDDEIRLARGLRDELDGHTVTIATSGQAALAHVEEDGPFDAIVCDLMMPDVSGIDVYEHLRRSHPGLERRMVFITGGAFSARAAQFLAETPNACLEKPFTLDELLCAIERAAR